MAEEKGNFSFLLVGAGGMGCAHARGFRKLGCRLATVVDIDPARAEEQARILGALRGSADYAGELRRGDFDFVVVATLPDSHASLSIPALQAGKHVFCEKPTAHTLADAQAMGDAAACGPGRLFVAHCLRYSPMWKMVVADIHSADLGKPLVMRMTGNQMSFGPLWRSHQRLILATSPIMDCGVHYVDLMRWIVQAEAVSVYAAGARVSEEIPPGRYNYGLLQVKFGDGSIGYYEAGWGPMMTRNAHYFKDFIGPRGSYSIMYEYKQDTPDLPLHNARYVLKLQLPKPGAERWSDVTVTEKVVEETPQKDELVAGEHRFFLDSLRAGTDLSPTVDDAYRALEIVTAADESVRTGEVVRLPYNRDSAQ